MNIDYDHDYDNESGETNISSPVSNLRPPASSLQPKVYIETYGCAFNVSDSETMAGILVAEGFRIADALEGSDVAILNTCTVKDRTWRNFEKRFAELKRAADDGGPRLVIAGCIPKILPDGDLLDGVAALGPDTLDRVGVVVRAALQDSIHREIDPAEQADRLAERVRLPSRRRNPAVEIIPLARGCLSACAFCQTRLARGRLVSFRPEDILDRARRALDEGVTELWLTAQDTGAWGRDRDDALHRLLGRLCALTGDFRVRLGMSSPIWIWRDLDPMLDALAHPKMFHFLHVPVQSGSDRVLRAMRRSGTVDQFERVCRAFAERIPDGSIMTDVIAGYPTETEEDFAATLALLERIGPAAVNRSKFSPRPGTAAALLRPHPDSVVTDRSLRLNRVVRRLARRYHRERVGLCDRVLTCEIKKDGSTLAHNGAYRPVILSGEHPLGQWFDIRYTGAADFHLRAERSL